MWCGVASTDRRGMEVQTWTVSFHISTMNLQFYSLYLYFTHSQTSKLHATHHMLPQWPWWHKPHEFVLITRWKTFLFYSWNNMYAFCRNYFDFGTWVWVPNKDVKKYSSMSESPAFSKRVFLQKKILCDLQYMSFLDCWYWNITAKVVIYCCKLHWSRWSYSGLL